VNAEPTQETGARVDAKIDALMATLEELNKTVDSLSDDLARSDRESIRRAFQARDREADRG
jgi:outer membrane murein-binding lipoprotein Lpp